MEAKTTNVWVGSEPGILKGVDLVKKLATNHFDEKKYGKEEEILAMCWNHHMNSKLYTGHKSGVVREFNVDNGQFGPSMHVPGCKSDADRLIGIHQCEENFLTCTSTGNCCIWKSVKESDIDVKVEVNCGSNVCSMSTNDESNRFAVGGKENPLRLFDLEHPNKPIFTAKNVPLDWLQLRVPVWVTGIKFLKNSDKVITCTGTSKIRLYDPSSSRRRPHMELNFDEYPLTALTLTDKNQVVVGNTRGGMAMFDLRKKAMVHAFKGFAGSIRGLSCHPTLQYIASCGLDRFLRIHNIESGTLVHKVYLKSRLSCLLFSDLDFVSDAKKLQQEQEDTLESHKRSIDEEATYSEDEELWQNMQDANDDDNTNKLNGFKKVKTSSKKMKRK